MGGSQDEFQKSSIEIGEKDEWEPAANLRPHHFGTSVKSALEPGKTPRNTVLNRLMYRASQHMDQTGYFNDIVGKNKDELGDFRRSQMNFLNLLHSLPENAVIQFDIKPDGICSSCKIGEHCTATNLRTKPKPIPLLRKDWAKWEEGKLDKIKRDLVKNGFKEGKDFKFKTTRHVLYDYGGKTLNEVSDPIPQDSIFNSMLVKVSALKGII